MPSRMTTDRRADFERLSIDRSHYSNGIYVPSTTNDGRDFAERVVITPEEVLSGQVDPQTVLDRVRTAVAGTPARIDENSNPIYFDTDSSRFNRMTEQLADQAVAGLQSQRERMLRSEIEIVRNYNPEAQIATNPERYAQALDRINLMRSAGMDINSMPGGPEFLREHAEELTARPLQQAAALAETVPNLRLPEQMPHFGRDIQESNSRGGELLSQAAAFYPDEFSGLVATATRGQVDYALRYGASYQETSAEEYIQLARRSSSDARNTELAENIRWFNDTNQNSVNTLELRAQIRDVRLDRIAALVESGADVNSPTVAAFLSAHPEVEQRREQFRQPSRDVVAGVATVDRQEVAPLRPPVTPLVEQPEIQPVAALPVERTAAQRLGIDASDGFSDREKQTILEASGFATDRGGADGRVDGRFGALSRQAEQDLSRALVGGSLEGVDPSILAAARQAFSPSITNAVNMAATEAAAPAVAAGVAVDREQSASR